MRYGRCARHRRSKKSEKPLQICHSNKEEYILLRKWIYRFDKTCKINLEPCMFLETGRGLLTKDIIREGQIIISIPECALITPATVFCSDIGEMLKKCNPPLSPQRLLSIFLLFECEKGTQSFWYAYLQSLPEDFTTPLYFSTDDLNCLPPAVRQKAYVDQKRVKQIWSDIHSFLCAHCPRIDFCTYKKFRWAWCVVNTRSVYMKTEESPFISLIDSETDVALAPYLDLLNHSSHAKTEAKLNSEAGCYEIITYDHYEKYSQVFIHYNPYSNEKLFLEYGFTLPQNPYNVYEFTTDDVSLMVEECNVHHWDRKASILKENQLDKGLTCVVDGMSWKLQTLLRVAAMSWEELQNWKLVYQGEVSRVNELNAVNLGKYLINLALERNKEYLAEKADTLSSHREIARTLAQDNRNLLEQSLSHLEKFHL